MVENVLSFAGSIGVRLNPKTTAALSSLRRVAGEGMPHQRHRPRLGPPKRKLVAEPQEDRASRKHYFKCRRLEKVNEELRAKVASFTAAKSQGGEQ